MQTFARDQDVSEESLHTFNDEVHVCMCLRASMCAYTLSVCPQQLGVSAITSMDFRYLTPPIELVICFI